MSTHLCFPPPPPPILGDKLLGILTENLLGFPRPLLMKVLNANSFLLCIARLLKLYSDFQRLFCSAFQPYTASEMSKMLKGKPTMDQVQFSAPPFPLGSCSSFNLKPYETNKTSTSICVSNSGPLPRKRVKTQPLSLLPNWQRFPRKEEIHNISSRSASSSVWNLGSSSPFCFSTFLIRQRNIFVFFVQES